MATNKSLPKTTEKPPKVPKDGKRRMVVPDRFFKKIVAQSEREGVEHYYIFLKWLEAAEGNFAQ